MSYYQTLLNLAVGHRYHRSGVCRCLDFRPTPATRAAFDRAGLLLRETADGIELLCDRERLEPLRSMTGDGAEPLSFDFRVFATDPEFRGFTEPFADAAGRILYFDNRQAAGGRDRESLSAGDRVSSADLRPADADAFDGVLEPRDRLLPPEFVLRLYADSADGPLLERWLDAAPATYRIDFESRRRYWKYYLLGKLSSDATGRACYVADADEQIEFESIGEQTLSNRQRAWTFRSKQPIPLNENYRYRFQLKQKGQNGETVLIPSLPFASIGQVGRETIAEQEAIVSEIYVNS